MTNKDDINRKLHEAMGRNLCSTKQQGGDDWFKCSGCGWTSQVDFTGQECPPKNYAGDLRHAFELVEFMRKEKFLEILIDNESEAKWCVEISRVDSIKWAGQANHESLSTAICLAAARALGIEEE